MEAKYLFIFRKFNALPRKKLEILCQLTGIKDFNNKEKRKLAKELAVIFYKDPKPRRENDQGPPVN